MEVDSNMTTNGDLEYSPSVSVIIPGYNSEATIRETLQSLKEQDYQGALEVIVVDDGSTDSTPEIAREYADKVIVQANKGPGVARNRGAKEAIGELIVFTDSDCVLTPQFITEIVKPLRDSDVVGSQGQYGSCDDDIMSRFMHHELHERFRREIDLDNLYWVGTHSACYRKDVFLGAGGFYEGSFVRGEDLELSQRLTEDGHRMVLNPNALLHHHHPTTLRKYIASKYARAYWMIWFYKKYPKRITNDPITPPARKLMMVYIALGVGAIPFAFLWSPVWYFVILNWVLTVVSTLPFAIRTFFKDPMVGLVAPWIMILRSVVFILGFGAGLWSYIRKREFDKVSY